jgi:hypothetical protein
MLALLVLYVTIADLHHGKWIYKWKSQVYRVGHIELMPNTQVL